VIEQSITEGGRPAGSSVGPDSEVVEMFEKFKISAPTETEEQKEGAAHLSESTKFVGFLE